jgi:hypothetical protein
LPYRTALTGADQASRLTASQLTEFNLKEYSRHIEFARNADGAELGCRLLGNAHDAVVTALETYLNTISRE